MKKIFVLLSSTLCFFIGSAQFVAKMEIKEPIAGLCSAKDVYVMFPGFKGQTEAECPVKNDEILRRLDSAVTFLKDNPAYEDKGMLNLIINCQGKVVQCMMDNKTKSPQLDEQIVVVFNSLGDWKPGKLNKKTVDTSKLWSFKIEKGKISFD